jgi:hypothetical protein
MYVLREEVYQFQWSYIILDYYAIVLDLSKNIYTHHKCYQYLDSLMFSLRCFCWRVQILIGKEEKVLEIESGDGCI